MYQIKIVRLMIILYWTHRPYAKSNENCVKRILILDAVVEWMVEKCSSCSTASGSGYLNLLKTGMMG